MAGWISLYRDLLKNPIVCKDSDHFAVWGYLLLEATHTDHPTLFKGGKIVLKRGQLITGRKKISDHFGGNKKFSESKIQRILKLFESEQMIEQQTSSKNRLITVLKYSDYQNTEQHNKQQVNNKRTTSEHRLDTNNNGNKEKNDNKVTKRFVPPTLEMVINYCKERKNTVDSNKFIDYYTSNGWQVGRNKMKDWKAAVRNWERSNFNNGKQKEDVSNINYNITDVLENNVTIRMKKDYCDKMGIDIKNAPSDETILQYEKL